MRRKARTRSALTISKDNYNVYLSLNGRQYCGVKHY